MPLLLFHDDDCGELLTATGGCPKCLFDPDMQSIGFKEVSQTEIDEKRAQGATFLGRFREAIY